MSEFDKEGLRYHACSSGTDTPPMVREQILLAIAEIDTLRAQLAQATKERDEALANGVLSQRVCDIENERAQLVADRDRLHTILKAVADVCIDKGGLRVSECVAEDAPPRAVEKLVEQRDIASTRAEKAERERDQARATVAAMTPVVEAADEWDWLGFRECAKREDWGDIEDACEQMRAVVENYNAAKAKEQGHG